MITNHLLKHLSIDIDENLYAEDIESDEAIKETVKLEFEALRNYENMIENNKAFQVYYNNLKDSEEKKIIKTYARIHSYTIVMDKYQRHNTLQNQLDLCETFHGSDMCHRDSILKKRVEQEINKLRKALEGDNIVDACVKGLNEFYKRKYPHLGKIDRAVKISTALHYTHIYKEEPFMIEEEAKDYAIRSGLTANMAWKKIIFQRLKKIVD